MLGAADAADRRLARWMLTVQTACTATIVRLRVASMVLRVMNCILLFCWGVVWVDGFRQTDGIVRLFSSLVLKGGGECVYVKKERGEGVAGKKGRVERCVFLCENIPEKYVASVAAEKTVSSP